MKNSRKKISITLTAIGLSSVMLVGSAFAISSNINAYTEAKDLLINTMVSANDVSQGQNYTRITEYDISKNGTKIMVGKITDQVNQQTQYYSNETYFGDKLIQNSEYSYTPINDKTNQYIQYIQSRDDGTYITYLLSANTYDDSSTDLGESDADKKFISALIDIVAGDAKNYFVSNGDTYSIQLEGAQIPEIVQLGVSALQSNFLRTQQESTTPIESRQEIIDILSLKNLSISKMGGSIGKNNYMDMIITLSGYDQNGVKQSIDINFKTNDTNIGTTTPKTIDLTGKKVVDGTLSDSPSAESASSTPSSTETTSNQ